MTPVYAPDKSTMLGFIMVDYDEPLMRIALPGANERMPTAQELLDRDFKFGEVNIDIMQDFLTSQRIMDCGAEYITVIWVAMCDPEYLLTLPRDLFQTVPEALGHCRKAAQRN